MHHYWIILISALILEVAFGYPAWLYARIRHPVVWMGAGIALLERNFNRPEQSAYGRCISGIITIVVLCAFSGAIAWGIIEFCGDIIATIAMASLLATRSLYDHVHDVYVAVFNADIASAREKVSRIVGRDVAALDEAEICRAAIESLAESFSDGVIAPLFWAVCFGLLGIACYKAINTADSMIGHKDERYRAFGWAAARLDDVANFIPARLSGLLIAAASWSVESIRCMLRDARTHASPNAGWPEAAMAGALHIQLGGTNTYDGITHESPQMGDGSVEIQPAHLQQALSIYIKACAIAFIILLSALLVT